MNIVTHIKGNTVRAFSTVPQGNQGHKGEMWQCDPIQD